MNVLHIIRDLSVATGGPATALIGLAEAQARRGLGVAILATDHGGEARARPDGVKVEVIPAWPGAWGFAPGFGAALERRMKHADIVHLHMVWDYPVWAGARAASRHGKPFILRACGQLDAWSLAQSAWKKRAYLASLGASLRDAAAIHFTSEGERENSRHALDAVPALVIPNGVRKTAYRGLPRSAFAGRFPVLTGHRLVLFLGRLHPKKQPEVLIDAFASIASAYPDARLVLVGPGEGSYLATLAARVRSLGLAERATFTGPLTGVAVTEAYRAAEVFVLPSLQENFGNAIVEAMAAGCPVVIGDRLDLAAAIDTARAGLVCPATAEAMAEALRTLLSDPVRAARMGANGRDLALQNFAWDPIADRLTDAYRAILERRPEPRSLHGAPTFSEERH